MNRRDFIWAAGVPGVALYGSRLSALTADHIIVVGAGIVGASIAYHLAKRGARVTVLEREHPAAGTTRNSFAWLNASAKNPRVYYELNLAGMAGWRRLETEIGPALSLQWGGSAEWCKRDGKQIDAMKKHVRERESWGYAIQMIDEKELKRLVPNVEPGELGAANYADQEGTVDPVVAARSLIAKAKEMGAEAIYPCEVTGVEMVGGRIAGLETSRGPMKADTVALATGNGTMELAAKAGTKVPLKESKGILAHTLPCERMVSRVLRPPGCNIKQNADGRVVTGTNFEDTGNLQATLQVGQQYLEAAACYLPRLKASRIEYMTLGYRVMPKDGLPIIGRAPAVANLYVAAMHSGMTLAPVIGQLAALEILEQARVDLLETFRPERFA